MPPKKKKTKAPANPARGFMTVSTPSKPKTPETPESQPQSEPATSKAATPQQPEVPQATSKEQQAPELHKLSPEELEKHLEDAELQSLVDNFGAKCKNDASRHATKLETEQRVLRPQATILNVMDWLPSELLDEILEREKAESQEHSGKSLGYNADEANLPVVEQDMTLKLWTLQKTLLSLGFSKPMVDEALKNVLLFYSNDTGNNKDLIWGLDQSLEWLGMHCDITDLPQYGRSQAKSSKRLKASDELGDTETTPSSSGIATPSETVSQTKEDIKVPPVIHLSESSDESDTYIDPDSLVPKYVSLQSRLYELQPSLFNQAKKSSKAARSIQPEKAPSGVNKLKRKIAKIERDPLFDQHDAELKWQQELAELRQGTISSHQSAPREPSPEPQQKGTTGVQAEDKPAGDAEEPNAAEEAGDEDVFGDLFAGEEAPSMEGEILKAVSNTMVKSRDFGKPTGTNPRRILEDACKARDSACKVNYRDIFSTSYSNRKGVEIKWSTPQDVPPELPLEDVTQRVDSRSVSAEMTSIATPTPVQAESYISCVALFMISSHSPKESKVSMRLPPAWKDLWSEFAAIRKDQEDEADKTTLKDIKALVQERISHFEDDVVLSHNFKKRNGVNGSPQPREDVKSSSKNVADPDQQSRLWTERSSTAPFKKMEAFRKTLPIFNFKHEILDTLAKNQALIICSETGSGKSTQVPSYILEEELLSGRNCKIYVTEPRRISAISLARRVSEELGEGKTSIGTMRSLIGYAIRLESKMSASSRLIFATTGVLVRMLEQPKNFRDITHLVLDEVHERTIDSDFLLIILRRLMQERPDLKVVLMSATVDAQRFSNYLHGAPVLNIPGRTFPVEVKYLEDAVDITKHHQDEDNVVESTEDDADTETTDTASGGLAASLGGYNKQTRETVLFFNEYRMDYKLIVELLVKIATKSDMQQYSKAILIFMPGLAEIRQLNDAILSEDLFQRDWIVHTLHSSIASEDQEKAFLVPPNGMRKIVIATNIAETGITIPDITAVIDTGKEKVMRFDEKRQFSKLVESFISRANAKQRRGRAGRVQNGLCFHLFTKHRHDKLLADQQAPEMLRLSLQDLVLRVKICNLGDVEQTLSEAIDPPSSRNIRRAIEALKDVKALTSTEALTPLGQQLAKLPLDVFLGKLIVYGAFFKCLDAALSIAAIISSKSPFVNTVGSTVQRELARQSFKRGNSDLLTVYNAYLSWKRIRSTPGANEFAFCRKNFLSSQTFLNIEDIKMQLLSSIIDAGLLRLDPSEQAALSRARSYSRQRQLFTIPERADINSSNDLIVNSVIAWSFYPKLLNREGKGWRNVANNQAVTIQPTSVNKHTDAPLKWLSFYHIMQARSRNYNAHETSMAEDFAIALFCGDVEFKLYSGVLTIDGSRIRFSIRDWKSMLAIKALSTRIRDILSRYFRNPQTELSDQQQAWLDIWQRVFTEAKRNEKQVKHTKRAA